MEYIVESVIGGKFRRAAILVVFVIILLLAAILITVTNIGGNEVGIVEKKFGGGSLAQGRIISVKGENGIQAQVLAPGWHFFYWPWQYTITKIQVVEIKDGKVGLVQAADGRSLPVDTIYAPEWDQPDKMLNAEYFLGEGMGYKGPQLTVLKPGKYRLNPRLFTVTDAPVTNVRVGTVAVIKSNVGEQTQTKDRLVEVGQRGIWKKPLGEGQYYLHTTAYEATIIDTRQATISYTPEKDKPGVAEAISPMTVRSIDGFTFPVDIRVTYQIDRDNAPLVVATVGDDAMVLAKLVTPSVRAIFRNNAEKVKALDYVQQRSQQEQQSNTLLKEELNKYGVTLLAVRIGDVGNELTLGTLLKTQTDREIALQEQKTFEEQQRAAEKQKALTKTTQEAEEEKRLATAAYGVKVAEEEKRKVIIEAQAEAEKTKLIADAKSQAYKLLSDSIGQNNTALIEIMKLVAENNIKVTPEVMVSGSSGINDALMGTMLKGMLDKEAAVIKK
ncbi:MAG: SPFH domain-containing protein [Planctomycetota bacterium]|nr:SPFH domain-containing protein [Planctomycetota bacterium]